MKKEEIIEGNRLIVEFMGLRPFDTGLGFAISPDHCHCNEATEEKAMKGFSEIARYHSSWDWLIPVCRKFEGILSKFCTEGHEILFHRYNLVCRGVKAYDIEQVFDAMIGLIKYYKENEGKGK
jgi:hypothetical protein